MPDALRKPDEPIKGTNPKPPKDRDDQDFLMKARKRLSRVITDESGMRQEAVDDLKFKAGKQWPEGIKAQRSAEDRPCLTINKMKTFVHQITNSQRENRPAINVSPVGDKGDPELAKAFRGLIRHIERESDADVAYDTGFDNAVSNGWGYWRVLTEYEDEDGFDQVIRIVRIRNPFTVYLDPDRKMPDGSDAKWGFVTEMIPREEFKQKYPDADDYASVLEGGIGEDHRDWCTPTQIRIAEYFVIETEMRTLVALSSGFQGWEDELDPAIKEQITAGTMKVERKRESPCSTVKWYTITGREIIEEQEWAGKYIPIVECMGDEIDIEGKVNKSGIIRDAKDSQRMYNYHATAETEVVALAPKAPYIMEEGQVEGHEGRWKQANRKSYPYLLYKGTNVNGVMAPPPQRQQPGGPPTGIVQAKQGAAQDMQATTGLRFDGTKEERMADESGVAIDRLQQMGNIGSYHYIDNLGRSLKFTGRVLLDLIPKIYDTKRTLTILREDSSEERVVFDPHQQKPYEKRKGADGKEVKSFNPKLGRYEVTVTIGPSFATKRVEASRGMLEFGKFFPAAAPMIADLVAKNQDWPEAEQLATRLAKALPPGMADIDDSDLSPQVKAMLQGLKQQLEQANQEKQQLMLQINSQDKDRAIAQDKIDKDYEAKLLKIAADSENNMRTHMASQLREIREMITVQKPPPEKSGEEKPKPNGKAGEPQ